MNEIDGGINRDNKFWYVVRTKAGEEHRANRNLLNQEIEYKLPTLK